MHKALLVWICNLSPYLYLSTNLSPLSLSLSHYPSLCVCLQKQASTCQTRFHIANVICKLVYTMYFFSPLDQSTPPHNQRIVPRPVCQSVNLSICQLVTLSLCHSVSWSVRSLSLCVSRISLLFLLSLMITRWYWHFIVAVCGMWHAARCTLQLLQLGAAAVTAIMHKLNSHANLKKQATVFMATTSQCVSNPHRVTASSWIWLSWRGLRWVCDGAPSSLHWSRCWLYKRLVSWLYGGGAHNLDKSSGWQQVEPLKLIADPPKK